MSKEAKSNEWDSLWQEYTKSLENWKTLFEQMKSCPDGISDILNINEIVQKFVNLKLKWRIIIENG